MNAKQMEQVEKLINERTDIDFDAQYFEYAREDVATIDDFEELVEDNNLFNVDVIYYANAIKSLQENDQSLQYSIQIAVKYGYELKDITSKILASLLASQKNREDFSYIRGELEEIIEA